MRARAECGEKLAGILLDFVHRQHDQRFPGNIADGDDVGRNERMADRQPQAIGRGLDDLGLQGHAVAQVGDDHHRHVQLAAHQQVFEIGAVVLDGAHLDAGKGAAVARQEVGEHVAGDERGHAEIELAPLGRAVVGEGAARIRHVGEDLRGVAQELVAVMRRGQPARMTVEKLNAEIRFELLDRLGDRGLRDRQVLRRARHRALFRDGDEILQLPEGESHGRELIRPASAAQGASSLYTSPSCPRIPLHPFLR